MTSVSRPLQSLQCSFRSPQPSAVTIGGPRPFKADARIHAADLALVLNSRFSPQGQVWVGHMPLLLYADDLILMSESASGLQKQLDALASFCEQRQLTVNLSKTKVVVFATRQSDVCDSGAVVERVENFKYLGFVVHATKKLIWDRSSGGYGRLYLL